MADHIANRARILKSLEEELVGPCPRGTEIDCSGAIHFDSSEGNFGPWKQKDTGEEILHRDRPTKRYGVGVVYPIATSAEKDEEAGEDTGGEDVQVEEEASVLSENAISDLVEIEARTGGKDQETEPYDLDLSGANSYRPSTLAVSFLADISEDSKLVVEVSGGRYRPRTVAIPFRGRDRDSDNDRDASGDESGPAVFERTWWLRSPVTITATFNAASLKTSGTRTVSPDELEATNVDGLSLVVEVVSRPRDDDNQRLLTVCLVNRHETHDTSDEYCLFQARFRAYVTSNESTDHILPYPGPQSDELDPEEKSFALLGRETPTFGVGHGCAADWISDKATKLATEVTAECLPTHELPSFTPDILRPDGTRLEVPMAPLAGLDASNDGMASLEEVISLYQDWIGRQKKRVSNGDVEEPHSATAGSHLSRCEACCERMLAGLNYIKSNAVARRAFQLTNLAILIQQVRTSNRNPRLAEYDNKSKRIQFSEPYSDLDLSDIPPWKGNWRAFQIAFVLMSIRSTAEQDLPERENVELIWFPTGGGKTEAYSALAAFSMFIRRMRNKDDKGVDVLMRYTLRLLTAQQFQRASALICAMEHIRRKNADELGDSEFTIGIWVGGDNTPNRRNDALADLRKLNRGERWVQNRFLVTRCPWCRAQLGPLKYKGFRPKNAPAQVGYEQRGSTVAICCSDASCEFEQGLPIRVIDEDIYDDRPSLVIGTVDKFAMLAWKPKARFLFGMSADGSREASPPTLIIQDELHLISGPLGSMSGLYETVVEELSTDRRGDSPVLPKIVCSTATIRRYESQIKALYGRTSVTLFPPPGIDAGDSFFAVYATDGDGNQLPGRKYVGVHGAGLGSVQTAQVRTFASLLQASMDFSDEERDPWWSLLVFFNSLRELGTSLSLFQSDIANYFKVLMSRLGIDWPGLRRVHYIRELTGRLRDDEIPRAISDLEATTDGGVGGVVDVCLASNIIEVGIDIDRLSLMTVVGQPKTTSQYIQVTGRVGRNWRERPGIVVTIYSPAKPRDRSHFEKFRSYHEHLDAQVEPTSVTPFSPPALDRALHAVIVSYVRQIANADDTRRPIPYPSELIASLRALLSDRVKAIDPDEVENFERVFDSRADEWRRWERTRWSPYEHTESASDAPLLHAAGSYISREWARVSWPTPTSLRNVDAECQAEVTQLYLNDEEAGDA